MTFETGRRDFLKMLGLAGAAVAMPKEILGEITKVYEHVPEPEPMLTSLKFVTNDKTTYLLGILQQLNIPAPNAEIFHWGDRRFVGRRSTPDIQLTALIEPANVIQLQKYMHMFQDSFPKADAYRGTLIGKMQMVDGRFIDLTLAETYITEIADIPFNYEENLTVNFSVSSTPLVDWKIT